MREGFTSRKSNNEAISEAILEKVADNENVVTMLIDVADQDMSTSEITKGVASYMRFTSRDQKGQLQPGEERKSMSMTLLGSINASETDLDRTARLADLHAKNGVFELDNDTDNIQERLLGGGILMVIANPAFDAEQSIATAQVQLRQEAWASDPAVVAPTQLPFAPVHHYGVRSHRNANMQYIADQVQYEGVMNYSEPGK